MTPDLAMRDQVPLAPHTTLGLGGPARHLVDCRSEADVRAALEWADRRNLPLFVLGGGSNVVFPDSGYPGLVARITTREVTFGDGDGPRVVAAAGAPWDDVVRGTVDRGWGGIECLSGIPGSVGATPMQNVGAYGQEVAGTIEAVTCLDRRTLEQRVFEPDECEFGYRTSRFKGRDRGRFVILQVTFSLVRDAPPCLAYAELRDAVARRGSPAGIGPAAALRRVREQVLALRRGKAMVLDPADPESRSAGSFFLNPVLTDAAFADLQKRWAAQGGEGPIPVFPVDRGVKVPAAWLVERAGFRKGTRRGGVGISRRHALALVNYGGTAAELVALAREVAGAVEQRFGIRLDPEPEIVGVT